MEDYINNKHNCEYRKRNNDISKNIMKSFGDAKNYCVFSNASIWKNTVIEYTVFDDKQHILILDN